MPPFHEIAGLWLVVCLFGAFFFGSLITGGVPVKNAKVVRRKDDPDLYWCITIGLGIAFFFILSYAIWTAFLGGR